MRCACACFRHRPLAASLFLIRSRRSSSSCPLPFVRSGQSIVQASYTSRNPCPDRTSSERHLQEALDHVDKAYTVETYVAILQECGRVKALAEGKRVHALIIKHGLEHDGYLRKQIIEMYLRCDSVPDALEAFWRRSNPHIILWTETIAAFARNGKFNDAIQLFRKMLLQGVVPDNVAFVTVLSTVTTSNALQQGKFIHSCIAERGFASNLIVGNALVSMYGKCGSPKDAIRVFAGMPQKDVVSWTLVIAVNAHHGHCKAAIRLFRQMQLEAALVPDNFTFVAVLSSCDRRSFLAEGRQIHACIAERGTMDAFVEAALVNMYAKCGSLQDARRTFDRVPNRDVVSFNSMIGAYAQNGHCVEALYVYALTLAEGVRPSKVTFITILNACTKPEAVIQGKAIHMGVIESGFESDVVVGTALLKMYSSCGDLEDARRMFEKLQRKGDVVSWNAMILACARHGACMQALDLFRKMQVENIIPDKITYITVFNACSSIAALSDGKLIHDSLVDNGLASDVAVGTALVNMYGKCGNLENAHKVFAGIHERNIVSWNAIITAYAQHGYTTQAFQLYEELQQQGMWPDGVTYVSILSSCSHAGLVEQGCSYFFAMVEDYGIIPTTEHHGCLIDLLGRAGWLNEAEDFISKMSLEPTALVWGTLLSACKVHGDLERGKRIAESVFDLDPEKRGAYVALSNLYAASGDKRQTKGSTPAMVPRSVLGMVP